MLPPLPWLAHCFSVFGAPEMEMLILDLGLLQLPQAVTSSGSLGGCCDHRQPPALLPGLHVPPTPTKDGGEGGAGPGSQVMAVVRSGPGMAPAALLML